MTTTPFAVLEAALPLPSTWPSRFEATLGRAGVPEVLVVAPGARIPPHHVLAPGVDVAVLTALDAQAAPWAAQHAPDAPDPTLAYVQWLVERHVGGPN